MHLFHYLPKTIVYLFNFLCFYSIARLIRRTLIHSELPGITKLNRLKIIQTWHLEFFQNLKFPKFNPKHHLYFNHFLYNTFWNLTGSQKAIYIGSSLTLFGYIASKFIPKAKRENEPVAQPSSSNHFDPKDLINKPPDYIERPN
ncbi:hypothetical protein BpHYR1_026032, partial [Brachionus plicatilis]